MSTTGPHPARTVSEKSARNRRIAQARAVGRTWSQIAEEFGLSERQTRRAAAEWVRDASVTEPLREDANAVLAEAVRIHREVLRDAAPLARRADNDSARIAALKLRLTASRGLLDVLAWSGQVPDTARSWRFALDVAAFVGAVLAAAADAGIDPDDVADRLLDVPGLPTALEAAS